MKVISFFLISIIFQSVWAKNTDSDLNIQKNLTYIMLGQSNMAGQGKVAELTKTQQTLPDNIHFYLNGSVAQITNLKKFGPEVSFAHAISAKHPDKLINIIKFAPGGCLMKDWLQNGHYYKTLKKQLERIGKNVVLNPNAIFWMQGERDTKSHQLAKAYPNNLKKLINALRKDFKNPKLAFIIAKISIPVAFRPAVNEVRKAQEKVSQEIPFVRIFATDTLKKNTDMVHFSTRGQLQLGQLFANAIF